MFVYTINDIEWEIIHYSKSAVEPSYTKRQRYILFAKTGPSLIYFIPRDTPTFFNSLLPL